MIHFIAAVLLAAATPQPAPKNVILLISDGAGLGHLTFTRHLRGEAFRIGTMPISGLHATSCADRAVTDSAAGASAASSTPRA